MPTVTVDRRTFGYDEIRAGTRKIKIWTSGARPVQYRFDPDPHDSKVYDKNQPEFYLQAATKIGEYYNGHNRLPDPDAHPAVEIHIELCKRSYKLLKSQ